MERPLKRLAVDASDGLLRRLPADVWNYIVWSLLTPSDRLQLRAVRAPHSLVRIRERACR